MEEFRNKYLKSIFLKRNPVTKKHYDLNAKNYFSNYNPFIPKNKNIKILDIGCGMGHFLYALKKYGYSNFIGIDVSDQMIDFLTNKIQNTELGHDFKDISTKVKKFDAFEFLRSNKGTFDLIVANDLIEHIPKSKILDLFKLVKKNLKNNGIFITKTANMTNLVSNMLLYDDFTHEVGFTNLSL
ncbi:MAG: class I SAM-dependent methyltransferase, partial [Candidatus Helarchaeota archaeon]